MPSRPLFENSVAVKPNGTHYSEATFTLTLLTSLAVRPDSAHTKGPASRIVTDADGRFPAGLTIDTPDEGAWRWRLTWPDGQRADALIEQADGSGIEIDDWVALADLPGSDQSLPQFSTLLSLHGGLETAVTGQIFTPAVGGGWQWTDPTGGGGGGIPDPASDGLFARLRSSGVGSWLAATAVGTALWAAADAAAARAAIGALPLDANVTTARTTGYTFQTSDRGAVIPVSGTFTFSLPDGMPVGAQAVLVRTGAGTVTLAAATTLVSDGTQLSEDGAAATVLHLGSNVWYAFGKLS
jgi:hypothetical protein